MNQYNNQTRPNRKKTSSNYRRDAGRNGFLTVLLFYVLPFIVVNGLIFILVTARPKGTITIDESSDYISTTMNLKIKSLLPIKTIDLTLNGNPIESVKNGSRTYTAAIKNNGLLEVKITSFNMMKTILYEQVNVLDDGPPAIKDSFLDNHILSITLEDTQSGIDYSSISAADEDNEEVLPLSIDRSIGLVTFELKKSNLTIKVKDNIGNELHKTFSPEGESIDDDQIDQAE